MTLRRRLTIQALAVVVLIWTIAPLVWVAIVSVMFHRELDSSTIHLYPHQPTLANYGSMLGWSTHGLGAGSHGPNGYGSLIRAGIANSAEVAVMVTVLGMLVSVPAAYALGRIDMRFRATGLLAIIATRALPPIATTIPFFALYQTLGLAGTRVGLAVAHLTIVVPLLVWIGTSFFSGLPLGLERIARVDGCSRWQAFWKVVVPASRTAITAMAVIAFLTSWDEFTFALIFNTGTPAQTFPPALASMFFQISAPTDVAAATMLGLLPPLAVAAIFQRYIRRVNLVGM